MSSHAHKVSFEDILMREKASFDDTFMSEKISIEPDLGDQRQSVYKALPAPPTTPKRVLKKYRVTALIPCVLAVASFVLTIVVVLAGQGNGVFSGHYLVTINATMFDNSVARSEHTSSENLTNTTNSVGGDKLQNMYLLYLNRVCSGFNDNKGMLIDSCESWSEASHHMLPLAKSMHSFDRAGQSNDSGPVPAKLVVSAKTVSHTLKAVFAFLIVSLIGSSLSAVSAIPAIFFPKSRLLIYFNVLWPCLASTFAFITAIILTTLIVSISALLGLVGDAIGVSITQGSMALLFVWIAWLLVAIPSAYWIVIWLVEVRKQSFARFRREKATEIGSWGDAVKEIWRDWKGKQIHSFK